MTLGPLQSFAAGAALCSTSLGTTFTVLMTSGLVESRLGVVLTSAAIMDDVVGLVMVQIISSLGTSDRSISAGIIVRPVFVSIAYAVATPLVCAYIVAPLAERFLLTRTMEKSGSVSFSFTSKPACFVYQSLFLIVMVATATYAGTSGLFAAYLAGTVASWFDTVVGINQPGSGEIANESIDALPQDQSHDNLDRISCVAGGPNPVVHGNEAVTPSSRTSMSMINYQDCYKKPVDAILKPFFFASIGFSIPITRMFEGEIVWRGIVYTMLMIFGKVICGFWLIRISNLFPPFVGALKRTTPARSLSSCVYRSKRSTAEKQNDTASTEISNIPSGATDAAASSSMTPDPPQPSQERDSINTDQCTATPKSSLSQKPLSLYPCLILGSAMVARGEIGFLISAVAQGSGIFSTDLFLVVTWAIFLCTFLGPISVGLLVRRVKKLQSEQRTASGMPNPLGVWGVSSHTQ